LSRRRSSRTPCDISVSITPGHRIDADLLRRELDGQCARERVDGALLAA
jgi:hypothetical protein